MNNITIIHNPRCSKSRETLQIIESRGLEAKIIDYLNGELNKELLEDVVKKLNVHPKEILRTKEDEFKALTIDLDNANEVIDVILKHPKILERPIVIKGNKAVIGRPPENILTIL